MTDREIMQQALEALDGLSEPYDVLRIQTALRERLAQPQRTHWEGCEEVHPECRKPEQEESEAVRAAWMAGYTEGEREAIENQPVQQQEPVKQCMAHGECFGGECIYTSPPQRPAEPVQEPVAWMYQDKSTHEVRFQKHMRGFVDHGATYETPLYTAPPRHEWVGLTEEEIALVCGECAASAHRADDISYALAIEAALREKNNG